MKCLEKRIYVRRWWWESWNSVRLLGKKGGWAHGDWSHQAGHHNIQDFTGTMKTQHWHSSSQLSTLHWVAESCENNFPFFRDNKNILTAKKRTDISRLNQPQVRIRWPTGKCSEAHSLKNNFCVTLALALLVGAFWLKEVKIRSLRMVARLIRYELMLDHWISMSGWMEDGWRERRSMCTLRDINGRSLMWHFIEVTISRASIFGRLWHIMPQPLPEATSCSSCLSNPFFLPCTSHFSCWKSKHIDWPANFSRQV